jgi:hypothetical protein
MSAPRPSRIDDIRPSPPAAGRMRRWACWFRVGLASDEAWLSDVQVQASESAAAEPRHGALGPAALYIQVELQCLI